MKKRYRNTAFLVELLVNILVFSVSCAVLVGMFSLADQTSKRTRRQTAAASEVQMLVETVRARGLAGIGAAQPLEVFEAAGGAGDVVGVQRHYNQAWELVEDGAAPYVVTVALWQNAESEAGTLYGLGAVAETQDGEELYRLDTAVYLPNEGGAGG